MNISLLEAPCEYVLHGPHLPIHWIRLCPHSGERVSRSHACPEDAVYSLSDRSSNFTQHLSASWVASPHVQENFTLHVQYTCTFILYTWCTAYIFIHHIHACHLTISSWQAGCSRLLMSDTLLLIPFRNFGAIRGPIVENKAVKIFVMLNWSN